MGQVQSAEAAADQSIPTTPPSHSTENSAQPSLDSLLAEATAFGDEDANLSLEEKAQKALECPCIAHLRTGPCGDQFSNAFVCFIKSTSEAKGSDCVSPFVYLQKCIKANPDAFPKDVLEDDEVKKEETPSQKIKIQPPFGLKNLKLQTTNFDAILSYLEAGGLFSHLFAINKVLIRGSSCLGHWTTYCKFFFRESKLSSTNGGIVQICLNFIELSLICDFVHFST